LEFLQEYGLFLAQAITIVVAVLVMVAGIVVLGQKQRPSSEGYIEIRDLNDKYEQIGDSLRDVVAEPEDRKAELKAKKKSDKLAAKEAKAKRKRGDDSAVTTRQRLYVLNFDGDLKAGATSHLREEISAVLPLARKGDRILVKLESPGGLVHGYGLAASQLSRIRDAGVELVVAVDKVAASGGYMMACVANQIIAAPFAVIGSIGVLAQLPNFNRLLKKHDIDFELMTAGEYKRTLTLFGENTDKGREKFAEELEHTHDLFKAHVSENRPQLDIARVATGEVWYGRKAIEVGLVDALQTSDGYIQDKLKDWDVFELKFVLKKSWQEKLGIAAEAALEASFLKIWQRAVTRQDY
jgi:serine protease SohB